LPTAAIPAKTQSVTGIHCGAFPVRPAIAAIAFPASPIRGDRQKEIKKDREDGDDSILLFFVFSQGGIITA
jgi:hypothetical protein